VRILVISHHEKNPDAGVSSVCLNVAAELRRLGHQVDEFHLDDAPWHRRVRDPRVQQLLFPYIVRRAIAPRTAAYDVIDATNASGWLLFWSLRRRRQRPALVVRSAGLEHLDDRELERERRLGHEPISWKYRLVHRGLRLREVGWAIRSADAMVCPARADRDYVLRRRWTRPSHIFVTPWGADEMYQQVRPRQRERSDDFRVLWWGSWISRKGAYYFPAAVAEAAVAVPGLRVTFGGTGKSWEELAESFPAEHRRRLTVLPFVDREQHRRILAEHDCLAFPSLSEGFGLAALEAMAAGLPVITTPTGIGRDIIRHGANGLVVPKRSPAATAAAIARLAADPAYARRLGDAARETAGCYTWRRVAEQTVTVYQHARTQGTR
jgi:glycosyltransferase involved in cell wall biosynthesis